MRTQHPEFSQAQPCASRINATRKVQCPGAKRGRLGSEETLILGLGMVINL